MSEPFWKTSLSAVEPNKILIRGYRVQDLMQHCSFGDIIYLTFKGELPAGNEGRMIEMIVVFREVADVSNEEKRADPKSDDACHPAYSFVPNSKRIKKSHNGERERRKNRPSCGGCVGT